VRQLFQKKHTFYVVLFIIIWTIQLSANYYHLFNPSDISEKAKGEEKAKRNRISDFVDSVSGVFTFSTGILLAMVRLHEPFFYQMIKKFSYQCFGILIENDTDTIKTQTLSTFLASSLNVELVHIILKGIKKFSNIRMTDHDSMEFDNSLQAQV